MIYIVLNIGIAFVGTIALDQIGSGTIRQTQGSFCPVQFCSAQPTRYNGIQRVYCDPFPKEQNYGWTSLCSVHQETKLRLVRLLFRQNLFGMLEYCCCFHLLLAQMQGLIVLSCPRRRHVFAFLWLVQLSSWIGTIILINFSFISERITLVGSQNWRRKIWNFCIYFRVLENFVK
jgi:hypothetical protein